LATVSGVSVPESDPEPEEVEDMKVLILGRERQLVDESVAIVERNGFEAVGVTRDEEALTQLDTGEFRAVVVGGGVGRESRPLIKQHAAPHGTEVLEARRGFMQSVQDHVAKVIVPRLRELSAQA
jgi:hypothetical protein